MRRQLTVKDEAEEGAGSDVQDNIGTVMDYPCPNEQVDGPNYTFRIGAPEDVELVEIRLDGGEWIACRKSQGFWWYDWESTQPGPHTARARARRASGALEICGVRRFVVKDRVQC